MKTDDYIIRTKMWKEKVGKKEVFVVEAVDLPLVTQGNSVQEAKERFYDAFQLAVQDPEFMEKAEKYRLKQKAKVPVLNYVELSIPHAQTSATAREKSYQPA